MIADRISLKYIYDTLLNIQSVEGKISAIRLKRKNSFGTVKSIPRFDNIEEFKEFMDNLYPYRAPNCDCQTKNEGIYILTSFQIEKNERTSAVYNYETEFKTSVKDLINRQGLIDLNKINRLVEELKKLFDSYVCIQYMEFGYTECEYIETQTNEQYDRLIELYEKNK